MEFADRLELLIQERNLSSYRLGLDVGVTDTVIGLWRKGKRQPNLESLIKLADYFDVSIDFLAGRTDDPTMQRVPRIYQGLTPEGKTLITISSGLGEPTEEDFKKADAARKRVADQLLPARLDEEAIQRIVDDRIRKFLEGAEPKRVDVD